MTEEQIEQKADKYASEDGLFLTHSSVRRAFIDGYHECQKEHEWHYDGTPDTTYKSCLVYCDKLPHIRIAYWNGQDWVENTIIRFPEVKAWRYADYPKEIE